jgi:copper transport protein
VISGSVLALLQLDHISDLWRTAYGIVLMAKLSLVAVLLVVAAGNRWRHTVPALSGFPATQMRLKYAIGLEIILAVIILAVVSLWRLTPPPRSLDAAQHPHATVLNLENKQVHARLEKQGDAHTWAITLTTPQGQVFTAEGVTLTRSNPDAGIEPIRRKAQRQSEGHWQVQLPPLPTTGHWQTRVDILIDDFDKTTLKSQGQE